jgi:hypothetical protein
MRDGNEVPTGEEGAASQAVLFSELPTPLPPARAFQPAQKDHRCRNLSKPLLSQLSPLPSRVRFLSCSWALE